MTRFRRRLRLFSARHGLLCVLAWGATACLLAFAPRAFAQVYVGADLGRAYQYGIGDYNPDYSACASHGMNRRSTVGDVFVGARTRYAGLEAGTGELFHSYFWGSCPGGSAVQTVSANYLYLRANAYIPLWRGVELVPFIGSAHVKFTNFEDAHYADGTHAINYTNGHGQAPLAGIGLQTPIVQHWLLRAEYQHVEHIPCDYWTCRGWTNSVSTAKLGLFYQF